MLYIFWINLHRPVADLGTGATGAPPFSRVIRKFQGKIVYSPIACLGLRRIVTVAFMRCVKIFLLTYLLIILLT